MYRLLPIFILLMFGNCGTSSIEDTPIWDTDIPESEDFDAENPEWNIDGSKIYFQHTDFSDQQNIIHNNIWSYDFTTQQRENVYKGNAYNADVFKTGEKLVFHFPYPPFGIYEYNVMGDSTSQLTDVEGVNEYRNVIGGRYSPDYKSILSYVFAGDPRGIIVMDSTGANPKMVVEFGIMGRWFPGGKKIVYVGWSVETQSGQIFEIEIDGTNKKQLTSLKNTSALAGPAVSPDGDQIVFTNVDDESRTELYLLDFTSGEIKQITNGVGSANGASWSPDGSRVAFTRIFLDGEKRLYQLDMKTYEVKPIFQNNEQ